jgi:predicted amidophosphoribosyltransferase
VAVLLCHLQAVADDWLGRGLPSPADAVRDAGFAPDRPWSWCARCGGRPHGAGSRSGARCPDRSPSAPECVVRVGAHDGALRSWVVDAKHAAWEPMAEALGAMLGRQLLRCGAVEPGDPCSVIVAVPSPWMRSVARGIDHAAVLARAAAREAHVSVARPLRQRHGGTQVESSVRSERVARAERFALRRGAARHVAGRHVVLVDDVRTTGATLEAASRELRTAGAARVTAAVVSVRE